MKDPFESSFNAGLTDAQGVLGQKFSVGAQSYEAVSIEKLSVSDRGMPGGKFKDVSTIMVVRVKVAVQAGIKESLIITVQSERLRVLSIDREGDDSWTVLCGPVAVDVPRLR